MTCIASERFPAQTLRRRRRVRPLHERFFSKVHMTSDCWLWTGSLDSHGYGRIFIGSKADGTARLVYAHRVIYEEVVGPIPSSLELDHLCRTPRCVRPDHLEAVSHRENALRGTSPCAFNATITHCPRGHAYSEENTYLHPRGSRICRECDRARHKKPLTRERFPEPNELVSERFPKVDLVAVCKSCGGPLEFNRANFPVHVSTADGVRCGRPTISVVEVGS